MARIAVLVSNPCTIDARVIKMARAARDAGHDVHVFGTLSAETVPHEVSDGITYHRLEWRPLQTIIASSPLRFVQKLSRKAAVINARFYLPYLKYRLFSRVFAGHVADLKPDIIHAHDLICLPAAYDASQLCGAKLLYDAHELEVHRNPPLSLPHKWFVSRIERKYGRKAFAVNTVGRKIAELLGAHLGRNDVEVIYNSPIITPCPRHVRGDLGLTEQRNLIVYVGKVAQGRGVSEILELLPKLKGVVFATIGPCDTKQRDILTEEAAKLGVTNRFRILPPVPFDQVVDYISGADAGIISVEPVTLSYRYCMPNKLFEMSFANIPIISNKLDEIEEFLAENRNGKIVDFEDQTALVYTIFRLFNETKSYRFDAKAQERLAEKYSWKTQASKLLATYDRMLAAR